MLKYLSTPKGAQPTKLIGNETNSSCLSYLNDAKFRATSQRRHSFLSVACLSRGTILWLASTAWNQIYREYSIRTLNSCYYSTVQDPPDQLYIKDIQTQMLATLILTDDAKCETSFQNYPSSPSPLLAFPNLSFFFVSLTIRLLIRLTNPSLPQNLSITWTH